jgi:hypothetical protein
MGAAVEVEVPSVARKPPVADVGDLPGGRRFDFNDEIHATTVCAVDLTPAEDHLTTLPNNTDLPGRESERDHDRIEDLRNQARTTMSRARLNARPRHDWWMLSEPGETTHVMAEKAIRPLRVESSIGRSEGWVAPAAVGLAPEDGEAPGREVAEAICDEFGPAVAVGPQAATNTIQSTSAI